MFNFTLKKILINQIKSMTNIIYLPALQRPMCHCGGAWEVLR
jgi:hypothetical protein